MNNKYLIKKVIREIILLLIASILLAGTSLAAEFYLWAGENTKTMPDGEVIPMWGFALDPDNDLATLDGNVTVPGPILEIPPGDLNLTIHLYNDLAVPVSIVIPGQIATMTPVRNLDGRVRSFTHETDPNEIGIYTWSNLKPGTYLYHSGTHPAVQVQMGLYGGLKVDAAVGKAYNDGTNPYIDSNYSQDAIFMFSEIDPTLHAAVKNGDYGDPDKGPTSTIDYNPKYFLINGSPLDPNFIDPNQVKVSDQDRVLIRFLNAGLENHVPVLQGLYMSVIAEDGNLLPYPKEQYSLLLPAGKTMDAIIDKPTEDTYPIYDRRLRLTNAAKSPGGMLAYLKVIDPPAVPTPTSAPVAKGKSTCLMRARRAPATRTRKINQVRKAGTDTLTITMAKYKVLTKRLYVKVNYKTYGVQPPLMVIANYKDKSPVTLGTMKYDIRRDEFWKIFKIDRNPESITVTNGAESDTKQIPFP